MPAAIPFIPLIGGALGALGSRNAPKQQTQTQGGTSSSTSTSQTNLPSILTNPATQALIGAQQLYGQGGVPVAGMSPYTGTAVNRLVNPGAASAPTTSSFAGGGGINPYLNTVFNAAADATQNRSATEFARAGRLNSGSHQQARSQELQQLAAGIYGPGYDAERARQFGAEEAGVTRSNAQDQSNLDRMMSTIPGLFSAGQIYQQDEQNRLNQPGGALEAFINQLNSLGGFFPGSTTQNTNTTQQGNVTQPLYNSPLSGFAGGAMLGNYLQGAFKPQMQVPGYGGGMFPAGVGLPNQQMNPWMVA